MVVLAFGIVIWVSLEDANKQPVFSFRFEGILDEVHHTQVGHWLNKLSSVVITNQHRSSKGAPVSHLVSKNTIAQLDANYIR